MIQSDGYAERVQCDAMLDHVHRRHGLWPKTLGADAGYKDGTYLDALEQWGIEPRVPVGDDKIVGEAPGAWARRRARRRQETRRYAISQRIRKRVEEIIGWCKSVGVWHARVSWADENSSNKAK